MKSTTTPCQLQLPRQAFSPLSLLGIAFFVCLSPSGCDENRQPPKAEAGPTRTLYIAAASDLQFALPEVIATFERVVPAVRVDATYGSTGNLSAQIRQQAPFDLFLSADIAYCEKLAEDKLGDRDSLKRYAIGQLALWVLKDSKLPVMEKGSAALASPDIAKIAIANPKHAPYGRAAMELFQSLGIARDIEAKLVLGENVAQAAQFVESEAADIGVIALALASSPRMTEKGTFVVIPPGPYAPLSQAGIVLSRARNVEDARAFLNFLAGSAGQAILNKNGFPTLAE